MRKSLAADSDLVLQLLASREDLCFFLRLNVLLAVEKHRGFKQPQPKFCAEHRAVLDTLSQMETLRKPLEEQLTAKYSGLSSDAKSKSLIFSLVSKIVRLVRSYLSKVQTNFPRFAEEINQETFVFLTEARERILAMASEGTVGEVVAELFRLWRERQRKEGLKLLNFYTQFGHIIDKRQERQQASYFQNKTERFQELLGANGASVLLHHYRTFYRQGLAFLYQAKGSSQSQLYQAMDLEDRPFPPPSLQDRTFEAPRFGPRPQEGMFEMLVGRFDRCLKQQMAANSGAQEQIAKYLTSRRKKERVRSRTLKPETTREEQPKEQSREQLPPREDSCMRPRNSNSSYRRLQEKEEGQVRQLQTKEYRAPIPFPLIANKENEKRTLFSRLGCRFLTKSTAKRVT